VALKTDSTFAERFSGMQNGHVIDEDNIAFAHGKRDGVFRGHEMHSINCFYLALRWSR
jgi:hypothetical protein